MTIQLSPEALLLLPVVPHPDVTAAAGMHACIHRTRVQTQRTIRLRTCEIAPGCTPSIIKPLRLYRTQTLVVDAAQMHDSKPSDDVVLKYCNPVARVMNHVLLDQKLRLEVSVQEKASTLDSDSCLSTVSLIAKHVADPLAAAHLAEADVLLSRTDPQRGLPASISTPIPKQLLTQTAALVTVAFLPPGTIREDTLTADEREFTVDVKDLCVYNALASLVSFQAAGTYFGILTDEITTYRIDLRLSIRNRIDKVSVMAKVPPHIPLSIMIADCAYRAASCYHAVKGSRTDWLERSGALNSDPAGYWYSDTDPPENPRWISDFDLYSVQRDPELAELFQVWRERAQAHSRSNPLTVATELSFTPHRSSNEVFPLRSPYARHDLPDDTLSFLAGRRRRSRNIAVDAALASSPTVHFTITNLVRTGERHLSQIVFGRIAGCDEVLCAKLYDERQFPLHTASGGIYLAVRGYSDEFVRQEMFVYDRLSDMQGLLLPHCYGSHLFDLPGGWQCYGLLLENIDGVTLGQLFREMPLPAPRDLQVSLVTQLRHAVRVLRSAGISQADWHESQVLCIADGDDYNIVLIDFALVDLDLGDEGGTPARQDLKSCEGMLILLKVEDDVIDERWLPALEFEY